MSDTSQGLSQRQSKAEHQPKRVRVGPAVMRRKVACFFLSESILKVSPQHTEQDGVSLVNNHMGKSDFSLSGLLTTILNIRADLATGDI